MAEGNKSLFSTLPDGSTRATDLPAGISKICEKGQTYRHQHSEKIRFHSGREAFTSVNSSASEASLDFRFCFHDVKKTAESGKTF